MHQARNAVRHPAGSSGVAGAGAPRAGASWRMPSVPRDLVRRERLLRQVRRGVQGPLTLVSAPAGSGKTVLLASWATHDEPPGPVAWLRMDEGVPRPGVFWSHVLEALRHSGAGIAGVASPRGPDSIARPALARLAARLAAHAEPTVLVLDNADYLIDRALAADVGFLLAHSDANLRLVVCTRTDPALPLHRYRLEGSVSEIRSADLAFTDAEAAALLRRSGLDLSAAEVTALRDRTGGWSAGLRFAAMGLAGRPDPEQAIREFTGDGGDVASYFVAEVLDAQTPATREFLLRTSVVSRLLPGLVEALTGCTHGQRVLEFMAQANAFIEPLPEAPGSFRYQSLFREFLRAQLAFEDPAGVPELHRRAARWLASNGWFREAIRHAAEACAWSDAAGYLVDDLGIGSVAAGPRGTGLGALFARLPDDEDGADAAIVRAARAVAARDPDRCAAELARARTRVDDGGPRRAQSRRVSMAALEAMGASLVPDVEAGLTAVSTAERELRAVAGSRGVAPAELEALVAVCKGRLLLWRGDLTAARAALAQATVAADASSSDEVLVESLALGALVEALSGRRRRALELADHADEVGRRCGHHPEHHLAAAQTFERPDEPDDPVSSWLAAAIAAHRARLPDTDPGSPGPPGFGVSDGPPGVIVRPLTSKEHEVLGHLADLLTTDEIAATMFVSVNTVRTHVRSILRKLGASRRNEAVRRAWELQLLGDRAPVTAQPPRSHVRTGGSLAG